MISIEVILALLIAFAISVLLSPFVIPFLRKLKIGNTEREEGVQSHLKKAGTPTMGGLIILISVLITSLLFVGRYPRIIPILFPDTGIWNHWIPGRLPEGSSAQIRWTSAKAEVPSAGGSDYRICCIHTGCRSRLSGDAAAIYPWYVF